MKYNMIDVGQRIKEERLKNGYKRQDDLCDKLHIGRNTLSAWENGKANIELGDFYHTFMELKARKINRTKFLDNLCEALIKKMDEQDEK